MTKDTKMTSGLYTTRLYTSKREKKKKKHRDKTIISQWTTPHNSVFKFLHYPSNTWVPIKLSNNNASKEKHDTRTHRRCDDRIS